MTADFRRGDTVAVPCRGCGRTYHRLTIAEGIRDFKCRSCGRVTKVRVRCWGEIHRIFSELVKAS